MPACVRPLEPDLDDPMLGRVPDVGSILASLTTSSAMYCQDPRHSTHTTVFGVLEGAVGERGGVAGDVDLGDRQHAVRFVGVVQLSVVEVEAPGPGRRPELAPVTSSSVNSTSDVAT